MTTKDYTVQEFGSQMQVSAELKSRMDIEIVEQMIKENLRKDARIQGYTEVSPPEVSWGLQAFRLAKGDEDSYSYVPCSPTDEGAFYYVGARMTAIDKKPAPAPVVDLDAVSAWCIKCRENVTFKATIRKSDSGRRMAQGNCPTCETKVNRILGRE